MGRFDNYIDNQKAVEQGIKEKKEAEKREQERGRHRRGPAKQTLNGNVEGAALPQPARPAQHRHTRQGRGNQHRSRRRPGSRLASGPSCALRATHGWQQEGYLRCDISLLIPSAWLSTVSLKNFGSGWTVFLVSRYRLSRSMYCSQPRSPLQVQFVMTPCLS